MPEPIAAVLTRLAGQPDRFDELRSMLADAALRQQLLDYTDEVTRGTSARYAAKELERTKFYAELVQREGEKLDGHEQLDAIQILDQEFESILDAASYALDYEDEGELLLPFARFLVNYLENTGRWREALSLYEHIVKRASEGKDRKIYAYALSSYGALLFGLSRFDQAEDMLSKAKQIAEEEGDELITSHAATVLGNVACVTGKYRQAIELQEEGLRLRRKIGKPHLIAFSLGNLATVYGHMNDRDRAIPLFEECLEISRESGDRRAMAVTLNNLGNLAEEQGQLDKAHKYFSESEALFREVSDRHGLGMALGNLGRLALWRRNLSNAQKLLSESLEINRQIDDDQGIAISLCNLGCVALLQGQTEQAEKLFEQSLEAYRRTGEQYRIAETLAYLALTDIKEGRRLKAWQRLNESLLIDKGLKSHAANCMALIATGTFLIGTNTNEPAALLLFGYKRQPEFLNRVIWPIEEDCIDPMMEQLNSELPAAELTRLEAQAEAMSMEELIDYALQSLSKVQQELNSKRDAHA